ncbi:spore germination protein [Paenibacillus sp. Marseille-Q4541]|uniref:spore germination protein n=1 Tax=Paenibacillus sp. Marseille-Q4541 TaxID=2831522 RepID=UPI001BAA45A5|nr:spore germination protein [Paenibacillus sp. Marseille-Q4541]
MNFSKKTLKIKGGNSVSNDDSSVVMNSPLSENLDDNVAFIKKEFGNSTDLIIRDLNISDESSLRAVLIYVEGLTDTVTIQESIIQALTSEDFIKKLDPKKDLFSLVKKTVISTSNIRELMNSNDIFSSILSGSTLILFNEYNRGIIADTAGGEQRSIAPPEDQLVLRGPRDSFTENLRTNTSLLRRKIKNKNLRIQTKTIGSVSQTNIAMIYIKGIASEDVVKELETKLDSIQISGVLESGIIEQLIEDRPWSPFPTIYNTERPDIIAAGLMEGRVAIAVDGTPFVLLVPSVFIQFFQAPEDYYERTDYGLLRLLRILSFFIALMGPSLYIALTTFHQEMIPTELFISIAAGRQGVPFPTFIEAIIMESTFEILREAGLRMPKSVGQAVSIVGALVIGQAAVEAGIISPSMVIVVSITAISSFVMPAYNMGISVRILRFPLMLISASFGLFGIFIGIGLILIHLSSLQSFGTPYLSPLSPFNILDQRDSLVRLPRLGLFMRKKSIKNE